MRSLPVMTLLPGAAAPVVLVALLTLPLAACGSSRVEASTSRSRLVVHVTLSGGPMGRDGRMALSDSPDVNDLVTVTGPSRHTWSARVGRDGDATFRLPAGTYRVSAGNCGARRAVRLRGDAQVSLHCDVP